MLCGILDDVIKYDFYEILWLACNNQDEISRIDSSCGNAASKMLLSELYNYYNNITSKILYYKTKITQMYHQNTMTLEYYTMHTKWLSSIKVDATYMQIPQQTILQKLYTDNEIKKNIAEIIVLYIYLNDLIEYNYEIRNIGITLPPEELSYMDIFLTSMNYFKRNYTIHTTDKNKITKNFKLFYPVEKRQLRHLQDEL